MRTLVIFSLLVLSFSVSAQNAERNMLLTNNSVESLSEIFLEPDAWIPYPKDADEWKVIVPDAIYRRQIESAEAIMAKEYPVIKATVFLDYVRNGNRNKYQNINFERRQDLSSLVIAEMLEGKNRFVDDILNLVWAICEESYWGVPAHLNLQDAGHGLPDVEEPSVDLFASETVALLAWTDFMIGDKLDLINPLIRKRIYYEANTRIFNPYLSTTKYKYMGYNKDIRRPNNWNPWINSNVMLSVLLLEKDKEKRAEVMYKSFEVLDNYLNPHPADGGCDEGPSYWGRAGASVFDCLDVLNLATAGKINLFSEPLIKNMGTYIYKAYIGKGYFLNFADAGMKVTHSPVLIYRYGKAIQSQTMMEMAAFFAELRSLKDIEFNGNLGRAIPGLYYLSEVLNQPSKEPLIRDFWLPDIQVMGARDMENSDKGFFMAVKGGHNEESHNHNDIGNFVVFADGEPAIIDIGVETYTSKTFGPNRYDIWTMNSAHHNLLPTVNGNMQANGIQFNAKDVFYKASDKKLNFSLDIANSYTESAGIISWNKEFTYLREESIIIEESYRLSRNESGIETSLMTCRKPEVKNGIILLPSYKSEDKNVKISYDHKLFDVVVEPFILEDAKLKSSWENGKLYRIVFTMKNKNLSGNINWKIELI